MVFTAPDSFSFLCFNLILFAVIAAIVAGVYRASPHDGTDLAKRRALYVALFIMLWIAVISLVVRSDLLIQSPMPRMLLFFGFINFASIAFAFSPVGRWLAFGLPIGVLVAFQAFRFPLELVLHAWAMQGTIPITMTWNGGNFDIVSGFLALIVAPFANRKRLLAWAFNIIGFVLLVNVARVAVFSSPLPFAWPVSPPLLLAFHLPYALIVPVCVGGAFFGHVVLTRALLSQEA